MSKTVSWEVLRRRTWSWASARDRGCSTRTVETYREEDPAEELCGCLVTVTETRETYGPILVTTLVQRAERVL